MTNVLRHSSAKNGWVSLKRQNGQLIITIRDDGKGIAKGVADFPSFSIGVGIGGMRQRTKDLGGGCGWKISIPERWSKSLSLPGSETTTGQTGEGPLDASPDCSTAPFTIRRWRELKCFRESACNGIAFENPMQSLLELKAMTINLAMSHHRARVRSGLRTSASFHSSRARLRFWSLFVTMD